MNTELQLELKRKYPLFFYGLFDSTKAPRTPIALFGIESGNGWHPFLDELGSKIEPLIQEYIKNNPEEVGEGIPHVFDPAGFPYAIQIKEKFGCLRIYISGGTNEMYKLIDETEAKSAYFCENCGKPGKIRGRKWLYCACEECCHEQDRDNKSIETNVDK